MGALPPAADTTTPHSIHPAAMQRSDGTISPLRFTLLWPYHVGLRAKLALQRRVSSEPAYSQASCVGGLRWHASVHVAAKSAVALWPTCLP